MKTSKKQIESFLGLLTQYDTSQIPLGGAISLQNIAMLEEGRLRRVPGIAVLGTALVDMGVQVPLLFTAVFGGIENTLSVSFNSLAGNIVNHTTGAVVAGGTAPLAAFGQPWTHTFYAQKHIVAGGGNHPYEITAAATKIDLAGTNVPHGNLVQSFLDRLYVADISGEEELVRYTDILTTDFDALNIVNTKEVAGKITALAVLAIGTDVSGIDTYLVIVKRNGIWLWNETSKDNISQAIGSESPHSFVNTQIGLVFAGKDGSRNSVFLIPSASAGEPKDIGRALHGLLNAPDSQLANAVLACAVEDQGFYRLIFAHTGNTTNNHSEVWLDLKHFAATGEIVWYGPMLRGDVDAITRTTARLEMVRRATLGANVWFAESTDTTQGFVDMDGNVLVAVMDLPLNVVPTDEEKIFEVLELQVAKEANRAGNELSVEVLSEDVSQGNLSQNVYDGTTLGVTRPLIPLYPAGTLGFAAKNSRVRLTHSINMRFDLLGATIQYLYNEEPGGRVKSKI
jgi:hypothetical protein